MDNFGGLPSTEQVRELIANLTGRERQILALLNENLSSKEIALRLSIERRTVDNHCCKICRKFGVNSRFDAVRVCSTKAQNAQPQPE